MNRPLRIIVLLGTAPAIFIRYSESLLIFLAIQIAEEYPYKLKIWCWNLVAPQTIYQAYYKKTQHSTN